MSQEIQNTDGLAVRDLGDVEVREIIGAQSVWESIGWGPKTSGGTPVVVRHKQTAYGVYVDRPNWCERLLGITFEDKIVTAIDYVRAKSRKRIVIEQERCQAIDAVCRRHAGEELSNGSPLRGHLTEASIRKGGTNARPTGPRPLGPPPPQRPASHPVRHTHSDETEKGEGGEMTCFC